MQSIIFKATLIGSTLVEIHGQYWVFVAKRPKHIWKTPLGNGKFATCKVDYIIFDRVTGRNTSFSPMDECVMEKKKLDRLIKKSIKLLESTSLQK